MRWILLAVVALGLMACSHQPLRCEGSLQPINAGTPGPTLPPARVAP
jgi:hypothetical protein